VIPSADTAELEVGPSLEEARDLARDHSVVPLRHTFIDDCETPVSAYLKLRGDGPSFLLESAEQGQRFGRWSFLGVQPRTTIRLENGVLTVGGKQRDFDDPYAAVAEELENYKPAPLPDLPPFAGGAVGLFGYDLVRYAEPTVGDPNPDEVGVPDMALMVSDVLLAFDHFKHETTILANVFTGEGTDVQAAYGAAVDGRSRAWASAPATCRTSAPTWAATATRRRSTASRSTSAPATSTKWSRASAGRPTRRSRRSRSTAACAT
jgi:anthranilate synthase component 1